ncbi:MAG: PDZ domain-containing protein, partial [Planctomycetota bacterium]|nr:PDZ domain-containing protein [Planctomycetota bacterium]
MRTRLALLLCTLLGATSLMAVDPTPEMKETLEQYRRLEELTRLVQREYVTPITRDQLWAGAYRGMLNELDANSRYLPKRELLLRTQAKGKHVGFGFDWGYQHERETVTVSRVIEGSPADLAGLVRADAILSVDGAQLKDDSLNKIRERMLSAGDTISMQVRHADGSLTTIAMDRAPLKDSG